jgi:hypothetical protein
MKPPRKLLLGLTVLGLAGCAAEPDQGTELPQPLDTIWAASIRTGDLFVLVPGTGSYDYIATVIDPMPAAIPEVDPRKIKNIGSDSIVFEQAIAAAHRAGIPASALEDGTMQFGIWGAGFTGTHEQFIYISYEGIRVPIHILGGESKCAHGGVAENILAYNGTNALADATDIYQKTQAWLPVHPSVTGRPRNIILDSHSWGGADAEYLTRELSTIAAAHGPLADGTGVARIALTIAMGVPGFVPGYTFQGPSLRYLDPVVKNALYEIDRPDDAVHTLQLQHTSGGHQYTIMFGDDFQGSYGITTQELSCAGVPGACVDP